MDDRRTTTAARAGRLSGFSLVELVVVVLVIALIAAIAVPRLNRASGAAKDASFAKSLAALREAIERYRAEHGTYPTCDPLSGNRTTIMLQLTRYTDAAGNYAETRGGAFVYGPYLRAIPALVVRERGDRTRIATADGPGVAWIYDPASGNIRGNTGAATDSSGTRPYSDY